MTGCLSQWAHAKADSRAKQVAARVDGVVAELRTGVSTGYLSRDGDTVQLYLQETLTFPCCAAEASVALNT